MCCNTNNAWQVESRVAFASFTTQVEDVFLMTLDDLDDEEKDRLWVSWRLCWNMLEQMAKVLEAPNLIT